MIAVSAAPPGGRAVRSRSPARPLVAIFVAAVLLLPLYVAFWRIVFPLLRPATASVLIFLGVWIWNDFLNPLVILGPSQGTTVTTGIYRSIGQYQADFGSVFALMFLATLPVLIFFLALQKQFVKGLTGGASKG
jgi:raffinose/stachyose/melibiose transport system permease protein